jgi:hypothetical protein
MKSTVAYPKVLSARRERPGIWGSFVKKFTAFMVVFSLWLVVAYSEWLSQADPQEASFLVGSSTPSVDPSADQASLVFAIDGVDYIFAPDMLVFTQQEVTSLIAANADRFGRAEVLAMIRHPATTANTSVAQAQATAIASAPIGMVENLPLTFSVDGVSYELGDDMIVLTETEIISLVENNADRYHPAELFSMVDHHSVQRWLFAEDVIKPGVYEAKSPDTEAVTLAEIFGETSEIALHDAFAMPNDQSTPVPQGTFGNSMVVTAAQQSPLIKPTGFMEQPAGVDSSSTPDSDYEIEPVSTTQIPGPGVDPSGDRLDHLLDEGESGNILANLDAPPVSEPQVENTEPTPSTSDASQLSFTIGGVPYLARFELTALVFDELASIDQGEFNLDMLAGDFPLLSSPTDIFGGLVSSARLEEYKIDEPKSVVAIQAFRTENMIAISDRADRRGLATLIDLNPLVNSWLVLKIDWEDENPRFFHLENGAPEVQRVSLNADYPYGIILENETGTMVCDLWTAQPDRLVTAQQSKVPYAPICQQRLFVRNVTHGHKTQIEAVSDILRKHVWGGEKIITLAKNKIYQDKCLETSEILETAPATKDSDNDGMSEKLLWCEIDDKLSEAAKPKIYAPQPAALSAECHDSCKLYSYAALPVKRNDSRETEAGVWYPIKGIDGVWLSTMQPRLASLEALGDQADQVNPMDHVERSAQVYLVAFDLDRFQVGYELGTEHPGVEWSKRIPADSHDWKLPGPDGFETIAPLARTGCVNPGKAAEIVATFTGGFKRYHGAFRMTDRATTAHGTHYGVLQNGVLVSKLQPGLSTAIIDANGRFDLKTWSETDYLRISQIRHARQNGLPIIDFDPQAQQSLINGMVRFQTPGNWSGAADASFRTVRGSVAIQEHEGRRYLIYGYFSSATPSAMARVYAAYGVRYAMLLDMNALAHTYMALYHHAEGKLNVMHLVRGMNVLDKKGPQGVNPRFIGYADNRDFFYLSRRNTNVERRNDSSHRYSSNFEPVDWRQGSIIRFSTQKTYYAGFQSVLFDLETSGARPQSFSWLVPTKPWPPIAYPSPDDTAALFRQVGG